MSIQTLNNWKELKSHGAQLGREELAKRVLECVVCMQKDGHYQGVIEFVGRMKAIAQACSYDSYWDEKVGSGYYKEMEDLEFLVKKSEHHYYGYCGKNLITDKTKP